MVGEIGGDRIRGWWMMEFGMGSCGILEIALVRVGWCLGKEAGGRGNGLAGGKEFGRVLLEGWDQTVQVHGWGNESWKFAGDMEVLWMGHQVG